MGTKDEMERAGEGVSGGRVPWVGWPPGQADCCCASWGHKRRMQLSSRQSVGVAAAAALWGRRMTPLSALSLLLSCTGLVC